VPLGGRHPAYPQLCLQWVHSGHELRLPTSTWEPCRETVNARPGRRRTVRGAWARHDRNP
jgi:hypothetical protein